MNKDYGEIENKMLLYKSKETIVKEHIELLKRIDEAIKLLGNYKHYSTPDEKQNGDNEDLVNNAFDILKEVE